MFALSPKMKPQMTPHEMKLTKIAELFRLATERAELSLAMLLANKFQDRLLARHVRDLRRCDRLRNKLKLMIETGTL